VTKITISIDDEVSDILVRSTCVGNILSLPQEQLSRPLYSRVNKLLEALGGKWNKQKRGHVFSSNPSEKIREALSNRSVLDEKKLFQFYSTPNYLASEMVGMAEIGSSYDIVVEPSAGDGAIVASLLEAGCNNVIAVEIQPDLAQSLKLKTTPNMPHKLKVYCDNFLTWMPPSKPISRFVANPPFSNQQDAEHVSRMLELIRPGGIVVSVMSSMALERNTAKSKRLCQLLTGFDWQTTPLPPGTFSDSGTEVSTIILKAARR
jgi:predicted RNA methylase